MTLFRFNRSKFQDLLDSTVIVKDLSHLHTIVKDYAIIMSVFFMCGAAVLIALIMKD